jgi:hypothetical protein
VSAADCSVARGRETLGEVRVTRPEKVLGDRIATVRGQRVVLDADLARVYGVTTKRLNEAVGRNRRRFPPDFAFRLTPAEAARLRSQIATSSAEVSLNQPVMPDELGSATGGRGGRRYLPWAFTEHGALMAANVLRSPRAVRMSVHVVRAFVRMRERMGADASILRRLAEIDSTLLSHDNALREMWQQLRPLLAPPPEPARRRIGFQVRDATANASSSRG